MGLIFIGLLALVLVFLFQLGILLKTKIEISSHCVHQVLKLQKDLSRPLESLLGLNPQASGLRKRKQKALSKLAAAVATGNAPAIGAAKAELLIVQQLQLALSTKQQGLISMAKTLRFRFSSYTPQLKLSLRRTQYPEESDGLAVVANPIGSLTPDHRPKMDFFKSQGQSYEVHARSQGLQLKFKCSATLTKDQEKWRPTLKPAKANWR